MTEIKEASQEMTNPLDIVHMLDVACLKPDVDQRTIHQICQESQEYGYAAVCVMSSWLSYTASLLKGSRIKVGASLGFPLGSQNTLIKVFEARDAIASGADELDMVMNIGALKSKDYNLVQRDIRAVVEAAEGRIVKVILETCLLSNDEKKVACQIIENAGADFVKTSTGFSFGGATVEDVHLLRSSVSSSVRVKAAGGIDSFQRAYDLVLAGAVRLGTSKALKIAQEAKALEAEG
jgi:deoxyribose-phosphate aldolase